MLTIGNDNCPTTKEKKLKLIVAHEQMIKKQQAKKALKNKQVSKELKQKKTRKKNIYKNWKGKKIEEEKKRTKKNMQRASDRQPLQILTQQLSLQKIILPWLLPEFLFIFKCWKFQKKNSSIMKWNE